MNILVLLLSLAGSLSAFHCWVLYWLCVWCKWPLFCWDTFLIPTLMRVFIMNGCWILPNAFSVSIETMMWFLFFLLLMWYITLIGLWILNNPRDPGIKQTWSWCMILFMYCWLWFANILLGILHLYSSEILACNFLFFFF